MNNLQIKDEIERLKGLVKKLWWEETEGQDELWQEFDDFVMNEYHENPVLPRDKFNKIRSSKYILIKK